MAYSTLVSLEKSIAQILHDDNYSISHSQKVQILSIEEHSVSFRAYLERLPEISKDLEERIRAAAAEAEDIIDMYMVEQIRFGCRCTMWISYLKGIKYGYELKKVRNVMDSIGGEMMERKSSIKMKDSLVSDSLGASSSSQVETAGEIHPVGLDEDLTKIKECLCQDASQLQFLPICGMGGIGKSTLARNAYDDRLIKESFHIRAWVTVSQHYNQRRVLLELLDSMKEFDPELRNGSVAGERSEGGNESLAEIPELSDVGLREKMHRILLGRKFLIVLDDVWSKDDFFDLQKLFPKNEKRSRIMLTTRLIDVASYAHSSTHSSLTIHEMSFMDDDQSWNLLREKVFSHQDGIPRELESIGKEIATSCSGLPLAIVVVAGLLSSVGKTLTAWEEIARNVKSSRATIYGQIEKILSLSYNHLPHHLRSCFLYMGGFPEDHEIKVADLIRLWIAENFAGPRASKSSEDIAEECLEDLVDRSLIIVSKRKSNGKIKSCRLHDMVRDICIKLSEGEKFLVHIVGRESMKHSESLKDQRRISLSNSDLSSFSSIFSPNIRTMMYFHDTPGSFGSFRLLRVLNLLRVRFKSYSLPYQLFSCFQLRYLAFCCDEKIPSEISNLQNLETLIIKVSVYHPLPSEIWNMPKLRHLIVSGCWLLDPSVSTFALQNLQTLRKVKNLTCSVSILKMIPNIKKLQLTFFRKSGNLLLHNLVLLRQLENLQLELETDWPGSGKTNLVVPSSLRKLTLIGWGRYKPHLKIVGPFPNLEVLKLIKFHFEEQKWTITDDDFPELKFLLLDGSNLEQWDIESSPFPALHTLLFRACWDLTEIPCEIENTATLELIELKLCSESLAKSAQEILEEHKANGDHAFQVRCVDCLDAHKDKEFEFMRQLESVRKPKVVKKRKWKSNRQRRYMAYGIIPRSSHYYTRVEHDYREADSKIVSYKDEEFQL